MTLLITALPATVRAATRDACAAVRQHYGRRLSGILLYGSQARGEAQPDSDVDMLVLLRGPVDTLGELRVLARLATAVSDRHGELVSIKPLSSELFEAGATSFVRTVRREAIEL